MKTVRWSTAAFACFLLLFAECDPTPDNPVATKENQQAETGSATMHFPSVPPGISGEKSVPQAVGRLTITVSGDGMDTISYSWSLDSIPVEPFTIADIPVGSRTFSGFLHTADGTLTHEGHAEADIRTGSTATVYLNLARVGGNAEIYVTIEGSTPLNPDPTGCWVTSVRTPDSSYTLEYVLLHQSEKLTGTGRSSDGAPCTINGTVLSLGQSRTVRFISRPDSVLYRGVLYRDGLMAGYAYPLKSSEEDLYYKWISKKLELCGSPDDECEWRAHSQLPAEDSLTQLNEALEQCEKDGGSLKDFMVAAPYHSGGYFFSAYRFCPYDSARQPGLEPDTCAEAVEILYPTEGEHFSVGDTIPIHYCANPDTITTVILWISWNDGITFHCVQDEASPAGNHIYHWVIPEGLIHWDADQSKIECFIVADDYNIPAKYRCFSDRFSIWRE